MIETLNQYDHALMAWLNYDGGTIQDAFWYAVSYKFSWVPLYVVVLITFVRWARLKTVAAAIPAEAATPTEVTTPDDAAGLRPSPWRLLAALVLTTALIIVAADQLSSGLIKPLVQRLRPSHEPGLMDLLHYVHDYRGGTYGFVSSHAANTAGLALWLSLLFRRRAVWYAMGAFFADNCYSRIYLGVHYPGDILCGTLIGLACATLGYLAFRKVCRQALPAPPHLPGLIALTLWGSIFLMAAYSIAIHLF